MEYFSRHPTLDMLEFDLLNELSHHDHQLLAEHLASCAACRVMSEKLREQLVIISETLLTA